MEREGAKLHGKLSTVVEKILTATGDDCECQDIVALSAEILLNIELLSGNAVLMVSQDAF